MRRLQPRTKSPRTVASTDVSNSRGLPQVVRARCGALVAVVCVGAGPTARGGAGASHVPETEKRGAARRVARGARQVSDVRESCGSVGLRNVLHTVESGVNRLGLDSGFRVHMSQKTL